MIIAAGEQIVFDKVHEASVVDDVTKKIENEHAYECAARSRSGVLFCYSDERSHPGYIVGRAWIKQVDQ